MGPRTENANRMNHVMLRFQAFRENAIYSLACCFGDQSFRESLGL